MPRTLMHLLFVTAALGVVAPRVAWADDKADCIAAFDGAQLHRNERKLTKAVGEFATCARDVCPESLRVQCVEQVRGVQASLPSVVLAAKDASGNSLLHVKVTIDGAPVTDLLDGKALSLDPGIHAMRFEAAGASPLEKQVVVAEGQKSQPVLVTLDVNPPVAPVIAPAVVLVAPPAAPAPVSEPPAEKHQASSLRWVGVGVGVAGLVAIGVGSAFGAMSFSEWSTAKTQCGPSCGSGSQAYASKSSAQTDATVSTAAFVVGGVLVATGVTLFVVAPSKTSSTTVGFTPTVGGGQIVGQF